jgi:hypothetical protein
MRETLHFMLNGIYSTLKKNIQVFAHSRLVNNFHAIRTGNKITIALIKTVILINNSEYFPNLCYKAMLVYVNLVQRLCYSSCSNACLKFEVQIVYLITSKQHKPAAFTLHDDFSIQTWAEGHSCYAQNVLSFDETRKHVWF